MTIYQCSRADDATAPAVPPLLARDGRTAASIDEVEALVTAYTRVFDSIAEALLLTAEVGEAFTAWRKHLPDLGEELADIVIYTMALAEMAGLDLDTEVKRKITKNHARVYARDPHGIPIRVHEAAASPAADPTAAHNRR